MSLFKSVIFRLLKGGGGGGGFNPDFWEMSWP